MYIYINCIYKKQDIYFSATYVVSLSSKNFFYLFLTECTREQCKYRVLSMFCTPNITYDTWTLVRVSFNILRTGIESFCR